jgi:hypothetical protein
VKKVSHFLARPAGARPSWRAGVESRLLTRLSREKGSSTLSCLAAVASPPRLPEDAMGGRLDGEGTLGGLPPAGRLGGGGGTSRSMSVAFDFRTQFF